MTQALYRKWRPRKWEKVVGQDHVVQTLRNAIKADRVGHAYLFSGPRGTGKTTTARLLAKAVNCLNEDLGERPCDECQNCTAVNDGRFLDLIEIDAASNTSVEDVRDLRDKINFSPTYGKFKVYIIDEVHMLSTAAFNALLKTLEEPPPHAIFVLATTEVQKIPATVLSRCQRHEFRRIPVTVIVATLQSICEKEKIKADEDALILIARQATGSLRDAVSLLDQLASTGDRITLELAQMVLGTATNQLVISLIEAMQKHDRTAGLVTIHKALDGGSDPRQYARQVVEYLRSLLLVRMGNEKQVEATKEAKSTMRQQCETIETSTIMDWIARFNEAINDLRTSWQPSLALEIAFAQAVEGKTVNAGTDISTPGRVQVNTSTDVEKAGKPVKTTPPPALHAVIVNPAPMEKVTAQEESNPVAATATTRYVTTQTVLGAWNQIRSGVKQQRSQTEALLNSQKLVQVKDGTLFLGFSSEMLRSKMDMPDNLDVTRRVIRDILQVDMPIKCIVVGGKATVIPEDMDLDADGVVRTALNLGGKLIHRD